MSQDEFDKAKSIVKRLTDSGFEAYFAGGCVRDRLLGRRPADYDIATSATPDEVQRLFRRTIAVGKHFGVIIVLVGESQFDVATFRSDGAYSDGRRPDSVVFSSAIEDVRRRDFTINGLLYDPLRDKVIDHVGGTADLERGIVRTIGDPAERFAEDNLRLLRAIRFAARFGFALAPETSAAVRTLAAGAKKPSPERTLDELEKMFTGPDPARAFELLDAHGLLEVVLPECSGKLHVTLPDRLADPERGVFTAFERMKTLLSILPAGHRASASIWAVLLEDQVAGATAGVAADLAERALRRLRASNDLLRDVACLVRSRDRRLFAPRLSAARRAIFASPVGRAVFDRHTEWTAAATPRAIPRGTPPADPQPLPSPILGGHRLMELGVPKGPELGRIMRRLRFLQLDGRLGDPSAAEALVRDRVEKSRPPRAP